MLSSLSKKFMHIKVVCACDEEVAEKERDKREQVNKLTVSLDVISLVASSCGYYRGHVEQRAAHEFAVHVATQSRARETSTTPSSAVRSARCARAGASLQTATADPRGVAPALHTNHVICPPLCARALSAQKVFSAETSQISINFSIISFANEWNFQRISVNAVDDAIFPYINTMEGNLSEREGILRIGINEEAKSLANYLPVLPWI